MPAAYLQHACSLPAACPGCLKFIYRLKWSHGVYTNNFGWKKFNFNNSKIGSTWPRNLCATDWPNHVVQKEKKKKKWHVTPDTWHLTCETWHLTPDMRHVTCDMWNVTHGGGWTFSQNLSSLALTLCDLWYLKIWRIRIADLNFFILTIHCSLITSKNCCIAIG